MSGLNNRELGIQAGLSPTGAAPLPVSEYGTSLIYRTKEEST